MPKVSVVVPVFGVEKYIERCARSLFEQTLDDMEFVFVDDSTKDNSIAVLEKVIEDYPNRKKQIKIIHHEQNKGLSHARETGVKNATGDYIVHCDSDDWVAKDMYKELYLKSLENDSDFVKCGHVKTDGQMVEYVEHVWAPKEIITKDDAISYLLQFRNWNSIWNIMVKRELYNNVVYTSDAMLEDMFVVSQLLQKSNRIGIVDRPYYSYYINRESICHVPGYESVNRRLSQAKKNLNWVIKKLKEDKLVNLNEKDIIVAKWTVKNMLVLFMTSNPYYQLWKNTYPEIDSRVFFSSNISLRNKIRFYFAHFHLIKLIK